MKKEQLPEIKNSKRLSFQLGDYCHFVVSMAASEMDEESVLYHGRIIKLHLGKDKVTYDLEFTTSIDSKAIKRHVTRVHNVDSDLCVPLDSLQPKGWHDSHQLPNHKNQDEISCDVLIDIDGYMKTFRTGWYDFENEAWHYYHEENDQGIDIKNMCWTYLPLTEQREI